MTDPAWREPPPSARFSDYLELTKPRLSLLSVMTALVGYFAAQGPPTTSRAWASSRSGPRLPPAGVAALNQWMESETDARMHRTAQTADPDRQDCRRLRLRARLAACASRRSC